MSAPDQQWMHAGGPAPRAYAPPPAKRPPIARRLGRLLVRLVAIAVVVTGTTYLLEWARTEVTATDGWKKATTETGQLEVLMPRKPQSGTFGSASTMRAADDDWEVLLIETPASDQGYLAQLFGNAVDENSIRSVATGSFRVLGGTLTDSRTFRHRLGKHAVEFWGTYDAQGVKRYLHEVVVIAENGSVITLKVEANADRERLVDYLFRNVEENMVFA